ncbi:MAG: 5-oxoprolinase/urea amidolyase family protein [Rhizobiaceae bacterium]|nr:5-oxoprolinase/urea amidolyase family protein [Rhizobiaceae bacterium]
MRFLPVRAGALLVELDGLDEVLALMASLENDPLEGIVELVPAARTVMVKFDPHRFHSDELIADLSLRNLSGLVWRHAGPLVEIPVRYDGEDLQEVADLVGVTPQEVVRRHTACEYVVAFTGFAPGFAYMVSPDANLVVPRRKTPRTRVPAGAVALADTFSGVYPKDSPGGWQLIGTTDLPMFDLDREPAALLQPGSRVRFIDISTTRSVFKPTAKPARIAKGPTKRAATIEVISTLFPLTFQDEGRPGLSAQGVSVSGAADKASYRIANRLVGNPPGTPAIEITLGEVRFKVKGHVVAALTGAPLLASIEHSDGSKSSVGRYEVMVLADGDVVSLGPPKRGLRSYLAIRGGFDVMPVMGSASRDVLAQIGPLPLVAGAEIRILPAPRSATVSAGEGEPFLMPAVGETARLDVSLGPRDGWFAKDSIGRFLEQEWTVSPRSSRIGLRLQGEPLAYREERELPSEATLPGAIQIPRDGLPVVFLTDHPVTGGYPVIANIASHHLDLAGQLPPGSRVKFSVFPQK